MNPTHLHLIFTHLPIVGLGFAIMVNLYALLKKNIELRKLSLWFYVIIGIFAALAYSTGDGAEKIMETYPGIGEDIIEPHENMALLFFLGLMLTAGVALVGLYLSKSSDKLLRIFNICLLVAGLMLCIPAVKTGTTGGAIRHTEITNGAFKTGK
jgi:uncharacterized membrane protein